MDDILKRALAKAASQSRQRSGATGVLLPPGRSSAIGSQPGGLGPKSVSRLAAASSGKAPPQSPDSPSQPQPLRTRRVEIDFAILRENKIVYDCRGNPVADKVKILRTQLLQRLLQQGGNSVLFTSPRPGEGKTINAINTAISIAQEVERTVLLIDANLRQPAIHRYLGLEDGPGLADYLLGKTEIADILVNPGIDKLTLLPGGRPLATSSEMLGASRMAALVAEMKNRYPDRILVFDGPDILTNADAQVFSRLVDGIVLVVAAEQTTREDVRQALERLGDNVRLLGTIFNRCRD